MNDREAMFEARVEAFDQKYPGYAQCWSELRSRLLALGGKDVVPHMEPDPHILALLKEGGVEDGPVILLVGEGGRCHANSAWLWAGGFASCICTGYALTEDDGLWRQHTWAIGVDDETIIETTVSRQLYFGVRLCGEDAEKFADDELAA